MENNEKKQMPVSEEIKNEAELIKTEPQAEEAEAVSTAAESTADTAAESEPAAEQEENNSENEKPKKAENRKIHSKFRFKYGSYATAITAIFLAVIILLNVLINVLNEKYPMTIDMTGDGIYTVSADNAEFLKTVDYPVKLKVLFTEEQYEGGYIAYHKNITDESNGKYYKQTVDLLKQYKKYNKNIEVSFIDPYSGDDMIEVIQHAGDADLSVNYGDIFVECYVDGLEKEPTYGVISFDSCYQLESQSTSLYAAESESYTLNGNKVEQAVANGIFKTVNLTNVNIGMLTLNSNEEYVANFKEICDQNAFTLSALDVIRDSELSKLDVVMICAPTADYTANEIEALEKWLDNDGKKGKTVLFFASPASPKLPNLYAFLEEWGIAVDYGNQYYSADSAYYSSERTNIYLASCYTDYTSAIDSVGYSLIANNMVPLSAVYDSEPDGTREVTTVAETIDPATYIKPDGKSDWKPGGTGDEYPAIMVSKDADEGNSSYVAAIASIDFITNRDSSEKTDNGNLKTLVTMLNVTSRDSSDVYVMETKLVSDTSGAFTKSTTTAQSNLMGIVFIFVIPAALIATAIVVYIKRKNY